MIISAHTCDTINRRSNTARRARTSTHIKYINAAHYTRSSIVDVGHTLFSVFFFFSSIFFLFFFVISFVSSSATWKALRCFRLETVEVFVLIDHMNRLRETKSAWVCVREMHSATFRFYYAAFATIRFLSISVFCVLFRSNGEYKKPLAKQIDCCEN